VTRREVPLDAVEILRALAEHEVDYTIIGGVAVQAHGHTRTTQDLDLVPGPGAANLDRLRAALAALGARPAGAPSGAAYVLEAQGVASLDTDAGGVDVHFSPPGAAPYDELRGRALELEVFGLQVAVAGRDDLIAMKRAAGRPIDRGDVIVLSAGD